MQGGLGERKVSRLSVRLCVKRLNCDKTEEKSIQIFKPYERSFCLVFWIKEWLVGVHHIYLKFWVNRPSLGCFLFEYEFWWRFRQDLYVFWAKNSFCNAKFIFRILGPVNWGGSEFFDETPKRHILGRFHEFWAIDRANLFTGFYSLGKPTKKRDTTKRHREVLLHRNGLSPIIL